MYEANLNSPSRMVAPLLDRSVLANLLAAVKANVCRDTVLPLICYLEEHAQVGLAKESDLFEQINDATTVIARAFHGLNPDVSALVYGETCEATFRVMLAVAIAHISRATPERGIYFAQHALEVALNAKLEREARRAFNVCSSLYILTGAPADGVEYGLAAANLALQIDDPVSVCAALSNVAAALLNMGLYAEVIDMSDRISTAYGDTLGCTPFVAQA